MRLTRRRLLVLGGAAALAPGAPFCASASSRRPDSGPRPILIRAERIPAFLPREPGQRRFGALTFRAGLALSSEEPEFGGWSGLWRSPDGAQLVAVSDRAHWLTAEPTYSDGALAGLRGALVAPMLAEDGRPLRRTRAYDTECLAVADGAAFVGIERAHEVRRFAWEKDGLLARGARIPVPPDLKRLPYNESLEALAIPPSGHPLAGSLIAIAERARAGDEEPTHGWVLTGPRRFGFDVARFRGFDITDLAFLPSGEALLLERRFRLLSGAACRIRRIAKEAFGPGAVVDGEVIFEADRAFEIDNMEGIATHRDPESGETVVTLISDDNFSFLQRTLLLEFVLADAGHYPA